MDWRFEWVEKWEGFGEIECLGIFCFLGKLGEGCFGLGRKWSEEGKR